MDPDANIASLESSCSAQEVRAASPKSSVESPGLRIVSPTLSMVNVWVGWEKVESWIWMGSEYGYDDWDEDRVDAAVL